MFKIYSIILLSVLVGFLSFECFNTITKLNELNKLNKLNKVHVSIKISKNRIDKSMYNDTKFSVKYNNTGKDRNLRFGTSNDIISFRQDFYFWKGGKRISKEELQKTIKKVFKKLPHIKTTDNTVLLVTETGITESNGGRIIDTGYGDLGVFQIRVNTSISLQKWLKKHHKDIYSSIISLRNKKLSEYDNLKHNIPYSIAVCVTEYWRKGGANFYKNIDTLEKRAIIWKSLYNTRKGKGTVFAYIKRVHNYES